MQPCCDVNTGKIYGCAEGSKNWWHEKGHIEFYNSGLGTVTYVRKEHNLTFFILFASLALIIMPFNRLTYMFFTIATVIFGIQYFYYYIYEELWCNKYAKQHYGKTELSSKA